MAVTNCNSRSLTLLTSAALGLPGINASAAVPAAQVQVNSSFGFYQESNQRMQVSVYHADAVLPLSDRLELGFSLDRDTYTGATPAFSLPKYMTGLLSSKQGQASYNDQGYATVDVVSVASGGVTNLGLTLLGGLNAFQSYIDGAKANAPLKIAQQNQLEEPYKLLRDTQIANETTNLGNSITNVKTLIDQASLQREIKFQQDNLPLIADRDQKIGAIDITLPNRLNTIQNNYNQQIAFLDARKTSDEQAFLNTQGPRPADPVSITQTQIIDFQNLSEASYQGYANALPRSGANNPDLNSGDNRCTGAGASGCFYPFGNSPSNAINNIAIGIVEDLNNTSAHLHKLPTGSLGYHSDSSGIYVRTTNGASFSLDTMDFLAPINSGNPGTGANDFWEILGFSQAINPTLGSGDGTNYATRIAYQTVANGFNGTLALNSDFGNIKAFWIHYAGFPQTPEDPDGSDGPLIPKAFAMELDNIRLSPVSTPTSGQSAWDTALTIYRNNYLNTVYNPEFVRITDEYTNNRNIAIGSNREAIDLITKEYNAKVAQLKDAKDSDIKALQQERDAKIAAANASYQQQINSLNSAFDTQAQQISNELERSAVVALYSEILNRTVPGENTAVERFQYQPQETRSMPKFNVRYFFDDTTLSANGGLSDEPDFLSNFGSFNISHEFNNKLTTLSGGYGLTSNTISRNGGGHGAGHGGHIGVPTDYEQLNGQSKIHSFSLSLAQVLDKNTVFQSSVNYGLQNGYLTNPYKLVYVRGEVTPEEYYQLYQAGNDPTKVNWQAITSLEMVGIELFREKRPDQRNTVAFSNHLSHYLPSIDASAHLDYRFYKDDWGIDSHTFEAKWYQSLADNWTVTPSIRYYSQSQAKFFAPYFLAPRADGFYSSDFRLSAYGDLTGGVTVSKQFSPGIKLEAGFEYTTHAGALKLGGGGVGSYADFDYYLAHANISVDLSSKSFSGSGDHSHHHHHNHGTPVPAGVMYGHMMPQSGDIMVGYRYAYSAQSGSMRHGNNLVDDQTLVSNGCPDFTNGCLLKPLKMHMEMHMLDLMYAPTDWLNIMVMPQIMNMDMTMSKPIRNFVDITEESTYGGHSGAKHTSSDLGDTNIVALFKVYEDEQNHHVHAGMGISAPTGSIDAQLSPPSLKSASGTTQKPHSATLQDYGMQLGSGTWDLKPNLTYIGKSDEWSWGTQLSGIKRLGTNKYGYAFGDVIQASSWGSYQVFDWLSASVRGVFTAQGKVSGRSIEPLEVTSSVNYPENYGGRYWDVGFGLNVHMPEGQFAGHSLSVEWLQPVATDFKGYQLDRDGALAATWNFAF